MKIRNGFVSNSSSSSFLIYGIYVEQKEKEAISKNLKLTEDEIEDFADVIDEKANDYGLSHYSVMGEYSYIGESWGNVSDDETGRQFKDRVEKSIEKLVGKRVKCSTHSEAWYNG